MPTEAGPKAAGKFLRREKGQPISGVPSPAADGSQKSLQSEYGLSDAMLAWWREHQMPLDRTDFPANYADG